MISEHDFNYMEDPEFNATEGTKKIFLNFLQEFYNQQEEYTYKLDEEETDLIITDRMPDDMSVVEKKPAITVFRGPMQPMELSMDQLQKKQLGQSTIKYSDLWSGQIRFECMAELGLEAEKIATRTALALITFEPILRQRGIHEYRDVTIGEEGVMQSDSEIVTTVVSVTLRYTAQFTWRLHTNTDAKEMTGAGLDIYLDPENYPDDDAFQSTDI